MPFPASEREVYRRNPLIQVICQLRFPAILKLSAESPHQFQDAVRADYPLYETRTSLPNNLPPFFKEGISAFMESLPLSAQAGLREHHFFTEDKIRMLSLNQEFVAITDNQYTDWQSFREQVTLAEGILQELYNPAHYGRVGLRYVDMLDRKEIGIPERPWNELLNASFVGMLGATELESNEFQALSTEATLCIPDVERGFVKIKHGLAKAQEKEEQVYVIDADFFTDQRRDRHESLQVLDTFNRWGGYLFRWAAAESLRDALGRD